MNKLKVIGRKLYDNNNNEIQLRGISSHGLSWYPEYVNINTFRYLQSSWNINTIRLAMYTAEENGYSVSTKANKERLLDVIDRGVNACVELGLYVIIDWHILADSNPLDNFEDAKAFFSIVSEKYQYLDNVIYEICNEPNGNTTWNDVYQYANEIIPIIRNNAKNSLIIVGTPCWSQDVDVAAQRQLNYPNIMYSLHFYSSTHNISLRNKIDKALSLGLPIFISEFGVSEASGAGIIDYAEANVWFDYIRNNNFSHIAWNLSNRDETCAFIRPDCHRLTDFKAEDLTPSGIFLQKYFFNYWHK